MNEQTKIEETQTDLLLIRKVNDIVKAMDEIDELVKTLSERRSNIDLELSDLLHIIENNDLDEFASHNVTKRIHDLRKKRRSVSNEQALLELWKQQRKDLLYSSSRTQLGKLLLDKINALEMPYKDRILSDEDIDSLLHQRVSYSPNGIENTSDSTKEEPVERESKKHKRTTGKNKEERDKQIVELYSQSVAPKEIAKQLGITVAIVRNTIYKARTLNS